MWPEKGAVDCQCTPVSVFYWIAQGCASVSHQDQGHAGAHRCMCRPFGPLARVSPRHKSVPGAVQKELKNCHNGSSPSEERPSSADGSAQGRTTNSTTLIWRAAVDRRVPICRVDFDQLRCEGSPPECSTAAQTLTK
jgi:hypothetical protein